MSFTSVLRRPSPLFIFRRTTLNFFQPSNKFHTSPLRFFDPYKILGVEEKATDEEIRKAHIKLAKQYHPDLNKAADAKEKFVEIQKAYDMIKTEDLRKSAKASTNINEEFQFNVPEGQLSNDQLEFISSIAKRLKNGDPVIGTITIPVDVFYDLCKFRKNIDQYNYDKTVANFPKHISICEGFLKGVLGDYTIVEMFVFSRALHQAALAQLAYNSDKGEMTWYCNRGTLIAKGKVSTEKKKSLVIDTINITVGHKHIGYIEHRYFSFFPYLSSIDIQPAISKEARLKGIRNGLFGSSLTWKKDKYVKAVALRSMAMLRIFDVDFVTTPEDVHPAFYLFSTVLTHTLDINTSLVRRLTKPIIKYLISFTAKDISNLSKEDKE